MQQHPITPPHTQTILGPAAELESPRQGRRVLLVSYLFPPIGGSGVQRNLKFVRYLPDYGWNVTVLSVKDILHFDRDESLLNQLNGDTQIIRTGSADMLRLAFLMSRGQRSSAEPARPREGSLAVRTYRKIRRSLLFPDGQVGWIPFAVRAGVKAVRREDVDVVIGSVQPVSSAIIARAIARRTGIPYVLDFRDGWLDDPYLDPPTRMHARAHLALEGRTLRGASAMTAYGEALANQLTNRYPDRAGQIHVIHNGFDPADFAGLPRMDHPSDRFRLSYVGTLQHYFGPNAKALLEAIRLLPEGLQAKLDVQFIGQAAENIRSLIQKEDSRGVIKFLGYVPRVDALRHLLASDACLLVLEPGDKASLTGKVFEYLASGHPIVGSLDRDSALADLLRKAGHGQWIADPGDPSAMTRVLRDLIVAKGVPRAFPGAEAFDRRLGARRLATLLDSAAQEHLTNRGTQA